jgi:hypothetical protein
MRENVSSSLLTEKVGAFGDKIDRQKIPVVVFNLALLQAQFDENSSPIFGQQKTVITGFNTDVEHEGVVYHVQTEDKGLKSPLILSLVYVGGTILASKRTPYDDLIAAGFDENKLAERLQRQHKLICAAIHTGRIEELKQQTERDAGTRAARQPEQQIEPKPTQPARKEAAPAEAAPAEEESDLIVLGSLADFMPPSIFQLPPVEKSEPVAPPAVEIPSPQVEPAEGENSRVVDYDGAVHPINELKLKLLDEKKFVAGEFIKVIVSVSGGADGLLSAADVTVTLKVLGSSFRPLIFSGKSGADGIVTFYVMLPYFTSGRAAILINASLGSQRAELRRVIHQA